MMKKLIGGIMNKSLMPYKSIVVGAVLMLGAGVCVGQTSLPIPSDCNGCQIYGAPQNVGDFDGDNSDDLAYVAQSFSAPYSFYLCVYSAKKNVFLLLVDSASAVQAVGDFNGDGKKELVINNKIYSYTPTLTKKKL
jgi:hypothetical protein